MKCGHLTPPGLKGLKCSDRLATIVTGKFSISRTPRRCPMICRRWSLYRLRTSVDGQTAGPARPGLARSTTSTWVKVTCTAHVARPVFSVFDERSYVNLVFTRKRLRYVRVFCYRKSVCRAVTFVRPTQGVETFGNTSLPFCIPQPSFDLRTKFYGDRCRKTSPSGALNARGVAIK